MKKLRNGALGLLALATMISSIGCGGIAAQRSVSPASFLIPGLIRNENPAPPVPSAPSAPTPVLVAVR